MITGNVLESLREVRARVAMAASEWQTRAALDGWSRSGGCSTQPPPCVLIREMLFNQVTEGGQRGNHFPNHWGKDKPPGASRRHAQSALCDG